MVSVERTVTAALNFARLSRIRSKIIVFALLATLIPSFFMGWLSYRNNRGVLQEKITHELNSLTAHASRELDFFLREREYEVRVFTSSYEIWGNLARISRPGLTAAAADEPYSRLRSYLAAVEQRFPDYTRLLAVDLQGRVLASSRTDSSSVSKPDVWLDRIAAGEPFVGDPYWDEGLEAGMIPIGQPVRDADNLVIGALVAKLNFRGITEILITAVQDNAEELYIINQDGVVLAGSRGLRGAFLSAKLEPEVAERLFGQQRRPHQFASHDGTQAVGTLEEIGRLGWGVVAAVDRAEAFGQIARLRNATLLLSAVVLVVIGAAAYLLGLSIVLPLDRLTRGAAKIASGDLKVRLPVYSRGELGELTQVFNNMATQLRKVLSELRTLSITDALTGLYNHRHMMETVTMEVARALRYGHHLSFLMVDIDNFKGYNDSHGHLEGDEVLRELGVRLKELLRTEDYAARYGGEEFLILLPETGLEGAREVAERLRADLERRRLGAIANHPGITVSIGVASLPENATDAEELISLADTAMYEAKRSGRNQVATANVRRIGGKQAGR